jgi:transposase
VGVCQGVAMESLMYHLGSPCPTRLCPAGRPPLTVYPLRPFQGWPARRAGVVRPSSTLLVTRRRPPSRLDGKRQNRDAREQESGKRKETGFITMHAGPRGFHLGTNLQQCRDFMVSSSPSPPRSTLKPWYNDPINNKIPAIKELNFKSLSS